MHQNPADLVSLAVELSRAKNAVTAATTRVLEIETKIIAATGFDLSEGQTVYPAETAAGTAKLVLKQPVNSTVDAEQWRKIRAKLPAKHPARDVFVGQFRLDTKKARELQENDQAAWAAVAGCVTRKPGKVNVKLEELQINGN